MVRGGPQTEPHMIFRESHNRTWPARRTAVRVGLGESGAEAHEQVGLGPLLFPLRPRPQRG